MYLLAIILDRIQKLKPVAELLSLMLTELSTIRLQVLNGMPGLTKVQTGTRLKDGLRT
jgi:hypothetical protein